MIFYGSEREEEIDDEETAGGDGESAQGLPGGGAVLGMVVRVEGDDADADQQRAANNAQQGLLKQVEQGTISIRIWFLEHVPHVPNALLCFQRRRLRVLHSLSLSIWHSNRLGHASVIWKTVR